MADLRGWPILCIICEDPAEYHCNTCGDILCPKCRDYHLKSNATRHHVIVSYGERSIPSNLYQLCDAHPVQLCDSWCRNCNKSVCNDCQESSTHNTHACLKMEEEFKEKRSKLTTEYEQRSQMMAQWKISLGDLGELKEICDRNVQALDKEIKGKAAEFYAQVKQIEGQLRKQLHDMQKVYHDSLQDRRHYLTFGIESLTQDNKELEHILRCTGNTENLLKYRLTEDKIPAPPEVVAPSVLVFTPGSLDSESLRNTFGSVSVKTVGPKVEEPVPHQAVPIPESPLPEAPIPEAPLPESPLLEAPLEPPLPVAPLLEAPTPEAPFPEAPLPETPVLETPVPESPLSETPLSVKAPVPEAQAPRAVPKVPPKPPKVLKKESKTGKGSSDSAKRTSLLPVPSIVSSIQTELKHMDMRPIIACFGKDQAMVKYAEETVKLLGKGGEEKYSKNPVVGVTGMAVTSQGEILLTRSFERCVKILRVCKEIKMLFKVIWSPYGICCLANGDIVLACKDDHKVVQYNREGKIVQEFRESSLRHPRYVTQNKVNHDVYVTEYDACRVLAFSIDGNLRYEYAGVDGAAFSPANVATDNAGRIIITDPSKDRVHVLNKDGQFLRYLLTKEDGVYEPWAVDVDGEGHVWVAENYTGRVKVFSYASTG